MKLSLNQIVTLVEGVLYSGDPQKIITGVASLSDAAEDTLSFFSDARYLEKVQHSHAGALLVKEGIDVKKIPNKALILVKNPSQAFGEIVKRYLPKRSSICKPGVHPSAVLGENVTLQGDNISIGANAVIADNVTLGEETQIGAGVFIGENVCVGKQCIFYPNTSVYDGCKVGDGVILHSGSVIGADGFGYEFIEGKHQKVPQVGIVQIDANVEIGANTTIDRARFGRTWIKEGTKIDNLVQIAHNVVVGKHCIIISQVGIAGSAEIGDYSIIAAQSGVGGHLTVGAKSIIAVRGAVTKSLPGQNTYLSPFHPVIPANQGRRSMALLQRLPELFKEVKKLKEKIKPS